jgi:branched-chain amino acid transport system permease protein
LNSTDENRVVSEILQLLVNGAALGSAYALVALGFVLVLNATGAVNFAHGDLVMAGGITTVLLAGMLDWPAILLLPSVMIVMGGAGFLVAGLIYQPLRAQPTISVLIATIALGTMLQNGATALFGPEERVGPPLFGAGMIEVGGLMLSRQAVATIAVAALLIFAQHALFRYTQFGRRLRATAQDRQMARAIGVPVNRMIFATFALSAASAGAAGLLLSNQFFVSPRDGSNLMIAAYIAAVLGGWGSLGGAVVGALFIALFQVVVAAYSSYLIATTLLYVCVLAVLVLRPSGLFGETIRKRV